MSIFLEFYVTYEREIAILLQLVLILIAVTALILAIGITKKLRKIIKEINTYLNCIMEAEQEEQKQQEISKKRAIQERQNQIITEVLEEIFP